MTKEQKNRVKKAFKKGVARGKKPRKRKANLINTPKRMLADSDEEYLRLCLEAADDQVGKQQDKVLELVDKLCRANKRLRDMEGARQRYAARLNKACAPMPVVDEETALALAQGWEE